MMRIIAIGSLFVLTSFLVKGQLIDTLRITDGESAWFKSDSSHKTEWMAGITAYFWTHNTNEAEARTLFRFDVGDIPPLRKINKAYLHLFYNPLNPDNSLSFHSTLSGSNRAYLVHVLEPWSPDTVNWNNQPDVSDSLFLTVPESDYNTQDYVLDVTEFVSYFYEHPERNFGWRMAPIIQSPYRSLVFGSFRSPEEKRPILEVIHEPVDVPDNRISGPSSVCALETFEMKLIGLDYAWTNEDGSVELEHPSPWETTVSGTTTFYARVDGDLYAKVVTVATEGCDTVIVDPDPGEGGAPGQQAVSIPEFISPNGDGINDIFEITGYDEKERVILQVFNAWNQLVYESSDYQNDLGEELTDGNYSYILTIGDSKFVGGVMIKK